MTREVPSPSSLSDKEELQVYLDRVVSGVVDHPDAVSVSYETDDMGTLFTVNVNPQDAGRVIGRAGNIAKAIRQLLRAAGFKNSIRASLRFNVPNNQDHDSNESIHSGAGVGA